MKHLSMNLALLTATIGLAFAGSAYAQPVDDQYAAEAEAAEEVVIATIAEVEAALTEAAIPAGAKQDYQPNPAIWRLSDEDTTIYLFGTVHILPPGLEWRTPQLEAIVEQVDELVLETSDKDAQTQMVDSMSKVVDAMVDRVPTSKRMSPQNGKKWLKLGIMAGNEPEVFDNMPLIMSMLGVGMSMSLMEGSMDEFGVETVLSAQFEELGKPVGSIENAAEVMFALMDIDEDIMITALEKDLDAWDGKALETLSFESSDGAAELAEPAGYAAFEMEHSWAKGEVVLEAMFDDSPLGLAMNKVLLEDRNRAWAQWLDNRLEKPGKILLAVGAGHFEGPDSLLLMLEERGLSAERIN